MSDEIEIDTACEKCSNSLTIREEHLRRGKIVCPSCGESIVVNDENGLIAGLDALNEAFPE